MRHLIYAAAAAIMLAGVPALAASMGTGDGANRWAPPKTDEATSQPQGSAKMRGTDQSAVSAAPQATAEGSAKMQGMDQPDRVPSSGSEAHSD
jgi:hypothetical protein